MDTNTNPCCCLAMGADMALTGSSVWHLIMTPGNRAGTHKLPLSILRSPVTSLFTMHKLLYFSFSALCLHIVVAPTDNVADRPLSDRNGGK